VWRKPSRKRNKKGIQLRLHATVHETAICHETITSRFHEKVYPGGGGVGRPRGPTKATGPSKRPFKKGRGNLGKRPEHANLDRSSKVPLKKSGALKGESDAVTSGANGEDYAPKNAPGRGVSKKNPGKEERRGFQAAADTQFRIKENPSTAFREKHRKKSVRTDRDDFLNSQKIRGNLSSQNNEEEIYRRWEKTKRKKRVIGETDRDLGGNDLSSEE